MEQLMSYFLKVLIDLFRKKYVGMVSQGLFIFFQFADSFNGETSLVLANAIHFKSDWLYKFGNVNEESFYLNKNTNFNVQMMGLHNKLKYHHDNELHYSMLILPYKV